MMGVLSSRPRSKATAAFLGSVLFAGACATNPVSGRREVSLLSEAQEIAIGEQADAEIRREMGVYDNPELQRYVSDVGQRLARLSHRPNLPWTFTIVDVPAINAFALPGGFIYITRGILPYLDDESELAGVLGHEIAHVTARHAAQQYTRSTTGGIGLAVLGIFVPASQPFTNLASGALGVAFLKYGREDENESDRVGMGYAAEGGWDPQGVPRFLATLSRVDALSENGGPNWLSTHPDPAARVTDTQPLAARLASPQATARNKDAFVQQISGIVVGDSPTDGIVRGNEFVHPMLRLAVTFPEGWELSNMPHAVLAQEPGTQHFMVLQEVERRPGSGGRGGQSIGDAAVAAMRSSGYTVVDGRIERINGHEAHIGLYRGTAKDVGKVLMRAAHIALGRQLYVLAGFAPEKEFEQVDKDILSSVQTFRQLSAAEASRIQPNRIDFHVVKAGDSWQSIAARQGKSFISAATLAIMNDREVSVQPQAGDRIKIVVEG
jgi:predicted Zn-dependent protease